MAIFASYSGSDGGMAAAALVEMLREHGFDVLWDDDLNVLNPMSIQAWMETAVRERIVVVVVSPDYLEAVLSNDFVERRGVRYELGLIRQKLYHHGSANGCGIVVVVPPGTEMNSLPAFLQQLVAHSFDPSTREGEEELVRSLRALEQDNGEPPLRTAAEGEGLHRTRAILSSLQTLPLFSEEAHLLARELAERDTADFELVWAFESVVAVAKAHGDVRLVRRLSEMCLRTLSSMPPLPGKGALEAKVLIAGKSWHLLREHRFSLAVSVAEDGTLVAEKCRDLRTVARGLRAQARVALHLAAEACGQDRTHYLGRCERVLMIARTLFRAIGGPASEELGVCASLLSEMELLRYQETRDTGQLTEAVRRARQAEELLTPGTEPYHWVTVLQARLCFEGKRYDGGKRLAAAVIDTAGLPEVVARARQVRADLLLATRKKAAAVRDLVAAEESFRAMGCDYAADTCWWTIARNDASQVTEVPLTPADLVQLEGLAPDPGDRRRAVLEHQSTAPRRHGRRSAPDWARLVDRVQHE